jgi:hypothetical protein
MFALVKGQKNTARIESMFHALSEIKFTTATLHTRHFIYYLLHILAPEVMLRFSPISFLHYKSLLHRLIHIVSKPCL